MPTTEALVGDHVGQIRNQAAALCTLTAGWDGADAAVVNPAAAAHAVEVAAKVTCPESLSPVLSPTQDGCVLLDWTWGDEHVEIEVSPDGHLEVLIDVPGTQVEFDTSVEADDFLGWIAHHVTGVGLSRFGDIPG